MEKIQPRRVPHPRPHHRLHLAQRDASQEQASTGVRHDEKDVEPLEHSILRVFPDVHHIGDDVRGIREEQEPADHAEPKPALPRHGGRPQPMDRHRESQGNPGKDQVAEKAGETKLPGPTAAQEQQSAANGRGKNQGRHQARHTRPRLDRQKASQSVSGQHAMDPAQNWPRMQCARSRHANPVF